MTNKNCLFPEANVAINAAKLGGKVTNLKGEPWQYEDRG